MSISINKTVTPIKLMRKLNRVFDLAAQKIISIEKSWKPQDGTPVFTVKGCYTSRGWTEWTQGFQFGAPLLCFDATDDKSMLEMARAKITCLMASHVSHIGVHDHGFNNVSTYGNLHRLTVEGKVPHNANQLDFLELALKISGAVQAARWTKTANGGGYIYSFNGPHSLFVDTIRSLRSLAIAHTLGHNLLGEQDEKISLLDRLIQHAGSTAAYSVYHGEGRDAYDIRGRTAHECVFNTNNGVFRCPNSLQGYSPFSTWTRGLAWALTGFSEQLEFLETIPNNRLKPFGGREAIQNLWLKSAVDTADFYIQNSCKDGIPMWDTGAPGLVHIKDCFNRAANPYNEWEPVDSSAAAIAAQGLLRLGRVLTLLGQKPAGEYYRQAGLTIADTLFDEPYLSVSPKHQGLILHSVYHRPNGWDYVAPGQKVPNGESSMWGDYHALELALMILREARGERYYTFFNGVVPQQS